MGMELVIMVGIAAVNQLNGLASGSNATLIWVAVFSFTVPSVIAAITGAIATHRTGPHSTIQKDMEYVKQVLVNHVTNKRIHQRKDRRDG